MPDMFGEGTPQRVADDERVVLVLHGLCEIAGHGTDAEASRIVVDENGATVGTFRLDDLDREGWDSMDAAVDVVLGHIAGNNAAEYWSHESSCWTNDAPSKRMPFAFHETGTLWMGDSELDSVSDAYGRVHATLNLFVLGGAAFPTRGSWNPFRPMVALAIRLADHLSHRSVEGRA
ncbi:GMC oxidoreductase [Microbacterium phyllosphaerae]